MKNQVRKLVAAAVLLGSAAAAHAAFIPLDSGVASDTVDIKSTNDFKSTFASLGVYEYTLGASLGTDAAGTVTYYYYGKEARYQNDFAAGDLWHSSGSTPQMQNGFGDPFEIGTLDVTGGLLDFGFCAFSATSDVGCVTNAQNDGLGIGSWQSIAYSIVGDTAWLFWDDSGAGPDDDHDDMLIKAVFKPTSVPEPGTLALFGVGLLGLVAGARRKQKRG
ncbi:MAG TPA: PEP-CTERM sorting domain-containing protein [Povalibacter sp.]